MFYIPQMASDWALRMYVVPFFTYFGPFLSTLGLSHILWAILTYFGPFLHTLGPSYILWAFLMYFANLMPRY